MYYVKTISKVIWNHEPYYESPARKSVDIEWMGNLYHATFYMDVDPAYPGIGVGCVSKLVVNGVEYPASANGDPCNVMTFDVTDAIVKGRNLFEFYFNRGWLPSGVQSGGVYAYLTLEVDEIVKIEPAPEEGGVWQYLPWIIIGVMAIAGLGAAAVIIRSLRT